MKGFLFVCLMFGTFTMSSQGTTTSSITGYVADQSNQALIGVNILVKHIKTGNTYGNTTDENGNYRISNVRVGGPYRITYSYIGYSEQVFENVYLQLGENFKNNVVLGEDNVVLESVQISASKTFAGQNAGASTQIDEADVLYMPSVDRELDDLVRLTPQVKESFGEGISIAGMNNRFNAIYIDGAVNNDVFGLSASGTNGGQTGISPVSPEIIDQIQVVISPFDVSFGGFAGGGINVVSKSGTNDLFGSAYYYTQNERLVARDNATLLDRINDNLDPGEEPVEATRFEPFTDDVYGFTLGGPIKKDKLFFFINGEIEKEQIPIPYEFSRYEGASSVEDIENLRNLLIENYDYDPGTFLDVTDRLDGTKFFAKLDYNLNQNHKLTFRHQFTQGEEFNFSNSGNNQIRFSNSGVFFPSTTNSSAFEVNSSFGNKASNNLIVGYTRVRDDRDPLGQDFPLVEIEDGSNGSILFGSESFSSANKLDQDVLTITDNFKLFNGDHTFTFGTHNEISSFDNLFIRQNFGSYQFNSLEDFISGAPATNYERSYSLVDDISGDGSTAAAQFTAIQFGLYAQDEWQVTPDFTLVAGIRLDVPFIVEDQAEDTNFNNNTLPAILEQYPEVEGARAGSMPEGQLMWSPRLGFNYDVSGKKKTILRGGLGIFTSRIPFVWPGGAFINNGLTIGEVGARDISPDDGLVPFIADPQQQYINPNFSIPSGQIDLFAQDFRYPQIFRTSLAIDHVFFDDWKTSIEGVFTKTLNNVIYQNVNSNPEVEFVWTNTPDNRPIYKGLSIDPTYSAVYYATNTNEGFGYNISATLEKNLAKGLNLFAAYNFGDSRSIFEGTSSQNSSQWRGAFNVNGRNFAEIGRSDFAAGHRIISALSYKIDWGGKDDFATIFSIFYEGESGNNYSYVYNEDNLSNERGSNNRERTLIFIPETEFDIHLVDTDELTAEEQWLLLDDFIEQDNYLRRNRGEYAEKNGARTPFESQFDFKILQNIGINALGKKQRLQLNIDIENFANLLNSNWGVVYNNPFAFQLLDFEGYDGTTPQFSFDEDRRGTDLFGISGFFSRWRARVGLRYFFE